MIDNSVRLLSLLSTRGRDGEDTFDLLVLVEYFAVLP